MLIMIAALFPKWSKARGERFVESMNPNERRATLDGSAWGAAHRDGPFFHSAALCLADVQQTQCVRNILLSKKHGRIAAAIISIGRP